MKNENELDQEIKEEYLDLIKKCSSATSGIALSNREMAMLYHWIRHVNDPMYSFVPEEYKKELPNYLGGINNGK